jgi:fatty acid desaturase
MKALRRGYMIMAFYRIVLPSSADPRDQCPLPKDFYGKSSTFGYLHVFPDVILFITLSWAIALLPLGWRFLCSLAIALVAYRLTFVIHDCSHQTLFGRRQENEIIGWLASSLLFISFHSFRRLHWLHHLHYRRAEDPQGPDYNGLVPGRDSVIWHLVKPLFFLNAIEKLCGFMSLWHCGMSPAEQKTSKDILDRVSPNQRFLTVSAVICVQALVVLLSSHGLRYLWAYLFIVLPLPTIGLFLSRLRSYLEHGNLLPEERDKLIARTHRSNLLERNLLCFLFFNFHNEHHRWPQVPSRWLPRLHSEITSGKIPIHEFSRSYSHSLAKLVHAILQR